LANSLHEELADDAEVLAVFSAEDAYISPNWYPTKAETHRHVPTWNYQVAHAHGRIRFSHEPKDKLAAVGRLTTFLETRINGDDAWRMADAPKDYMDGMIDNIVAFTITVDRLVAKSKLNQNHLAVNYDAVMAKMDDMGKPGLAAAMARFRSSRGDG
ncbi:MAG: FMN-binding negative transcriptional regulator, partial [Alphaproteobacteria bacterium]|nr:FMN-binding negative transcriptional regulator [Alphaproteobacteria bacterium]